MPQAKKAHTTKPVVTPTAALIAAHRKAYATSEQADAKLHGIVQPDRVQITIPEIGSRCIAYDLEQFDRLIESHIGTSGLSGVLKAEFRGQMGGYREALALLLNLREKWRQKSGVAEIEETQYAAYEALDKARKALLGRLNADRKSAAPIAEYVASCASMHNTWELRQILKLVGKAAESRT